MRVKTLTLTTASAAALTIGLASPALAMAPAASDLGAANHQAWLHQGAQHRGSLLAGAHHQVTLPRDDGDDEGDGGGGGGEADIGSQHNVNRGPRGLCGVGGHIGGLAQGCGEESGDGGGDDDDDGGGHGDHAEEESSNCCGGGGGGGGGGEKHVRIERGARERVVVHREVQAVPRGAVRAGFGGSQGSNAPLGMAGLSLMLGGAGLLPLARRRMQASGRS
jgi:hypothetical protein